VQDWANQSAFAGGDGAAPNHGADRRVSMDRAVNFAFHLIDADADRGSALPVAPVL